MKSADNLFTILWLQSGGCGGCTLSTLNAEAPGFLESLRLNGIHLLWHPSISEESGEEFHALTDAIEQGTVRLDALLLEGSVIMGPNKTGLYHKLSGRDEGMYRLIARLIEKAKHVVAIGTCAAYGGISMTPPNIVEACGLQYSGKEDGGLLDASWRDSSALPVINIAGCPTHPNWVVETLALLARGELKATDLDEWARPRSYTDHLVHHGCSRNEYYEYKASAIEASDQGCLMENLGCLGTQARADCNTRLWNGEGSCLRGGYACINCTAPEFERPRHSFTQTPKIAGIPVGLPTDMPKAWFVALSSLAKAATPKRLKTNAVSNHIVVRPGQQVADAMTQTPSAKKATQTSIAKKRMKTLRNKDGGGAL